MIVNKFKIPFIIAHEFSGPWQVFIITDLNKCCSRIHFGPKLSAETNTIPDLIIVHNPRKQTYKHKQGNCGTMFDKYFTKMLDTHCIFSFGIFMFWKSVSCKIDMKLTDR